MDQEQEKLMVEGIKILIADANLHNPAKNKWLDKYEDVFNPPKFGEALSKRIVN